MDRSTCRRHALNSSCSYPVLFVASIALLAASTMALASEPCGTGTYPFPYTDVASVTDPFCPGIMEAYVTGISKGTSPTTFSPNDDVIRLQMTTFLQRTVDQVLARTGRRAALNQWWTPQNTNAMQMIALANAPDHCATDSEYIWVTDFGQVVQLQANTGNVIGTWTGATASEGILAAAGNVFVTGATSPGELYVIDPAQTPGAVITAAGNLGAFPYSIAFDGANLWTANLGPPGSVSIITPQATTPYPPGAVNNVSTGFNGPFGILYDGAHIWVTDLSAGTLLKLDASGNILQTVTVGTAPHFPVFDGTNIWVPNETGNSITVVQASTGNVVATITADATNQLMGPTSASFDGERILVTNRDGNSVTVFKAADLSFIANLAIGVGTGPYTLCSDGINFWITLAIANLLRF